MRYKNFGRSYCITLYSFISTSGGYDIKLYDKENNLLLSCTDKEVFPNGHSLRRGSALTPYLNRVIDYYYYYGETLVIGLTDEERRDKRIDTSLFTILNVTPDDPIEIYLNTDYIDPETILYAGQLDDVFFFHAKLITDYLSNFVMDHRKENGAIRITVFK